jgi:S1-C subfamily serine protease
VGPSSKGNLECGNKSARSFAVGEILVDEAVGKSTTVYTEEHMVVTRRKSNSFVKVAAEKVGPAVVRLDTERDAPIGAELVQSHNKLFRNLFGDEDSQTTRVNSRRERGQGSGLVFDGKMGTIVTNAHVIKGADYVKVITGIYGQLLFDRKLGIEEAFNHKQFCCKLAKVNFFHTSLYSQL